MGQRRVLILRTTTAILTLDEVWEALAHLSAGLKHCRVDEYRTITLKHADRLLDQALTLDASLAHAE